MSKQQEILSASLKLFAEFGFHATPTSKIAKEAGVANGTLFHYYKTKDELILALYRIINNRLNAQLFDGLEDGANFKDLLKAIYRNTIRWSIAHPQEYFFIQQFNASPFLVLVPKEEIVLLTRPQLELFEAGKASEVFKNLPASLLCTLLNNHIYGIIRYLNTEGLDAVQQEQLTTESFELLWEMLATT